MIRWVKHGGAVWSGILLVALLYKHPEIAIAGGILNLAGIMDEKLPSGLGRFAGPSVLVINTVLSAYATLKGGSAVLAVLVAALSLLSWNAGLFIKRWANAPLAVQYQYLRRVGTLTALGLMAGFSAVTLQGRLALVFLPVFLLMLTAGFLWLRIISEALKNRNPG